VPPDKAVVNFMEAELVAIGVVTKPHGVRGVFKIWPYFLLEEVLDHFPRVWLTRGGQVRAFIKEWYRQPGRFGHLKLQGFENADAVEAYRGWQVSVPRKSLPPLPEGQYYTFQIVGLTAVAEDGTPIGPIIEVLPMPAHDVYVVRTPNGEALIPAVAAFVRKIDLDAGQVIISAISGLID
jgi:16S rRNA processing protein RimM